MSERTKKLEICWSCIRLTAIMLLSAFVVFMILQHFSH